jgi:sulfite reductase (ferredoxin)
LAFESQLALEEHDAVRADRLAYQAMLTAARSLIRSKYIDITEDADHIVNEFRTRFVDTKIFLDKYHAAQFANYLLLRHEETPERIDEDHAHRIVEEAQLFIDACYACDARMSAAELADAPFSLV